jgi:glutamine synthetase
LGSQRLGRRGESQSTGSTAAGLTSLRTGTSGRGLARDRVRPPRGRELEAYVFAPDGHGGWQPLDTPGAFVYGTGSAVDPFGLIDAIWTACAESDIPLESVNSEYDAAQFEFTLRYRDALRATDDAFLFKVLAREVAQRLGLLVTFMGKPLNDRGGSGLHVNFSFTNDDQ